MSDKLQWLDKHMVLLSYETVYAATEKENFKLRPDLEPFLPVGGISENYLQKLAHAEKWKDACEYLSYCIHKRAAIWWGYRCLLSLYEELEISPSQPRDIADIGKPEPHVIPDWAKMPEPDKPLGKEAVDAELAEVNTLMEELKALIPADFLAEFNSRLDAEYAMYKKEFGHSPIELLQQAIDQFDPDLSMIDEENSPIVKAEKELKEQIEKTRQETVELIKSVLPPKVPAHQLKLQNDAMEAVYRWVVHPDEVNSQKAMDTGNACPDMPAGLLSLASFWSFGNLTPTGTTFVPTPPGLAANGINSALLMAALHPGGTRKTMERFQYYFELGLEVAYGKSNWSDTLEDKEAPHHKITPAPALDNKVAEEPDHNHVRFRGKPTE